MCGKLPSTGQDIEVVREAARAAVEVSSLRSVSRDVGMSPTGLDRFLRGSQPYRATAQKLNAWYLRTMDARGERLNARTARAVLTLLTDHLPVADREAAVDDVLEALRRRTASAGAPVPRWLGKSAG